MSGLSVLSRFYKLDFLECVEKHVVILGSANAESDAALEPLAAETTGENAVFFEFLLKLRSRLSVENTAEDVIGLGRIDFQPAELGKFDQQSVSLSAYCFDVLKQSVEISHRSLDGSQSGNVDVVRITDSMQSAGDLLGEDTKTDAETSKTRKLTVGSEDHEVLIFLHQRQSGNSGEFIISFI